MNTSVLVGVQNQLLATKFFVPFTSGPLISRPRLSALLAESRKRRLTLVSAPAGFGKTTLLSTWAQSLPASNPHVAWVSLDEEDNEPRLFWLCVLTALAMQQPECFTPLLMQLQSPQAPSLRHVLTTLINLLAERMEHFVLILDDYQVITEQQVHTTLSYLVEHLPPQLRIILATRTDPPLPLSLLRACQQVLEIRMGQLCCTAEETRDFFHEVMSIKLPDEMIQEVTARTEGWLVGLQLLGLSLRGCVDSATLLQETSGGQHCILDYLTQVVLMGQSEDVQTFLLSTSILEQLNASLCDAVMQQSGSQQMLEWLERANVFVVSLDHKRQWYRYHALFAQALRYQIEQTHSNMVSILHHRASLWYAQHNQTTQAILHAFRAKEWQWAADLIESKSIQLMSFTWGASSHTLAMLQGWIEQLPAEIMHSRPRLCLACAQLLWTVAPQKTLEAWLDIAEATLTTSLTAHMQEDASRLTLALQTRQYQENLLGEVITFRAVMRGHEADGQDALPLCQQALALLSADNIAARTFVAWAQLRILYASAANDAVAAIEHGLQCSSLTQATGKTALAIGMMGETALYMLGTGRLHEIHQLTLQAMQLGRQPRGLNLPDVCWPAMLQAEVLREWNQLDAALDLAEEAISLCSQTETMVSITYSIYGYVILMRIALSRGELDRARSALQEFERIRMHMNQPLSRHYHCLFTTIDQVRLWLACGELDHATCWAEEMEIEELAIRERHSTPFAYEREEVACVRVLLAKNQPTLALQRLEPVLQRATVGQRWGHVIEIQLLQALAHHMRHELSLALDVLSKAVCLAEPEGFIRTFVEEGAPMAALLSRLREEQRKAGSTPYLDTVLNVFPPLQNGALERFPKRAKEHTLAQSLRVSLTERELQVLQLLARGSSNQRIGQELVIAIDTVKRHVSHIFSKLEVNNRVQAVRQACALGLLSEEL